jgi:hypothetical protein
MNQRQLEQRLLRGLVDLGLPDDKGPAAFKLICEFFERREREVLELSQRQLCVKELAFALGRSPRFVYAMRQRGFKMHGRGRKNQTASPAEALIWIDKTNFRMLDGNGKCKNSANIKR